jgi:SAM-dependent methyltransferase
MGSAKEQTAVPTWFFRGWGEVRFLGLFEQIHARYSYNRRLHALSDRLAEVIPTNASVLDVGCGDGELSHLIMQKRPDVRITGIDVLLRPKSKIPVMVYDGQSFPASANEFDAVMFNDVLHHTEDPSSLLREAARVARSAIILKDHTLNGFLAGPTLRFMDWIGNARHGVVLPYNYWPKQKWLDELASLELAIDKWHADLKLYPNWADWMFGRSLHFVAKLDLPAATQRNKASEVSH